MKVGDNGGLVEIPTVQPAASAPAESPAEASTPLQNPATEQESSLCEPVLSVYFKLESFASLFVPGSNHFFAKDAWDRSDSMAAASCEALAKVAATPLSWPTEKLDPAGMEP